MWPTMMGTWSRWAPQQERSRLIGIANSGSQIGTVVGFSYGQCFILNIQDHHFKI
jgi:predicted MFS family arabinose efflux permease